MSRTTCSTSSTSPRPPRSPPTSGRRGPSSRICGPRAAHRCWSAAPGSYVQAVVDELEFPGTDPQLRAELEAELADRRARRAAHPAGRGRPRRRGRGAAQQRSPDRARPGGGRADRAPVPGPAARPAGRPATTRCCSAWTAPPPSSTSGSPAGSPGCSPPDWSTRPATLLDRGLRDGRTASRALGYQQVVAALDGASATSGTAPRPSRRCAPPGGSSAGSAPGSAATGASRWLDAGGPDLLERAASYAASMSSGCTTGVPFSKGHGTENDFVLLPDPDGVLDLTAARVAALCDRRRGLGADGVLRVVRWAALKDDAFPAEPGVEWFMDYRNADGSVAEMCGNGVRVFARYLADAGWLPDGGDAARSAPGPGSASVRVRPATGSPSTWARRASARPSTAGVGRARVRRDRRRRRQPAPGLRHRRRAGRAGPDRRARARPARCSRTG